MEHFNNVVWQTRNEMPVPTNPLQELREILTTQSRDMSEDKMIACMYGIIVGWDDEAYDELKEKHGWTDDNIKWQKLWNENYNKAWNLYMSNNHSALVEALEMAKNWFNHTYNKEDNGQDYFDIGKIEAALQNTKHNN